MRILDRYILKELSLTFLAVLLVLLLITFGTEATRLLAEAIQGKVPASSVFQLLLLKIPPALEIILPLVALLAVILSFGRLYQDQEMVVLQSCAVGPEYFRKLVIWFLLPVAMLMAWISLVVTPWSYQQEKNLITQAQTLSPITGLVAGKFNALPNGQGVLYSKEINQKGDLTDIWLKVQNQQQDMILIAKRGRFEWIDGRVALILEHGWNYQNFNSLNAYESQSRQLDNAQENMPSDSANNTQNRTKVTVQQFARFEGYLPDLTPVVAHVKSYEKSSYELWQSQNVEEQAILQWRIATPLAVVIIGLIGLKMSRTGPRQGRFAKIFIALVIYIIFNQLLVVGRDAMANGTWSLNIGLWPILILFALFALFDWGKVLKKSVPKSRKKSSEGQPV